MLDSSVEHRATSNLLADRYELYAEIGRGGFGVVYDALDIRLLRRVALKLPCPSAFSARALERFTREMRTAARVQHKNVCRVLDAGMLHDGRPFIAMERLVGETLFATVERRMLWTPDRAIEVALDLLAGLSAVHALGIVHRDVKPANVFLAQRPGEHRPIVKLLDFGSCWEKVDGQPLTTGRRCVGTPSYMAPEQLKGARGLSPTVDLYAVAVILFEMLSGRLAYDGDLRKVVFSIVQHPFPRLREARPDLPGALDAIITRATSRDVDERYPSAAELARELELARLTLGDDELPTVRRARY